MNTLGQMLIFLLASASFILGPSLSQAQGLFQPNFFQRMDCEPTTIDNCALPKHFSGGTIGSCATGYAGVCTYQCAFGNWSQVTNTCIPCLGKNVNGTCWYVGAQGASCTSVCSTHSGYNSATESYAGSGGSNANCQAVMTVVGGGHTFQGNGSPANLGCAFSRSGKAQNLYRNLTATTEGASSGSYFRLCSCNN